MIIAQAQISSSTPDIAGMIGNIHTILYFVNRGNPRGPNPTNPRNDDAYDNWEYSVQKWKNDTYGAILGSTGSSTTVATTTQP